MKKLFCLIISLLFILSACSQIALEQKNVEDLSDEDYVQLVSPPEYYLEQKDVEDLPVPPPNYPSFSYDSIDELYDGLMNEFTDEIITEIESDERGIYKGTFRAFLMGRQNKKDIYVPYYQGERIPFRNEEGFANITVLPSDWLERPWIWFHCGLTSRIMTMYLDDNLIQEANNKGCSWLLNQLYPDAPNVGNIKDYPHYKKIYEQELGLADRKVNALVYEFQDESDKYVNFVYDGILVSICADARGIDDEWFSQLSFEPFKP